MGTAIPSTKLLSIQDVAKYTGMSGDTVLDWINADKLVAIDLSIHQRSKARWRIRPSDLEDFLRRREKIPRPEPSPRVKKRPPVKDYFPDIN